MSSEVLEYALRYAENAGWKIHPCKADKRPYLKAWQEKATADPEQIKEWWSKWPNALIGCATGPDSGIWVLDADLPTGPEHVAKMELPATLRQQTGSGGLQLFFSWNGHNIRNSSRKIAPDCDVRGDGGYVILPPSPHPSGGQYQWLDIINPVLAPDWLSSRAAKEETKEHKPKPTGLNSPYGLAALSEEIIRLSGAGEGERNETLNICAYNLGQLVAGGQLDESQVINALSAMSATIGLGEAESVRTISSGINSGMQKPRIIEEKGSHVSKCQQVSAEVSKSQQNVSKESAKPSNLAPVSLHTMIEDWIKDNQGIFSTYQIDTELNLKTRQDKNNRSRVLNRLEKQGLVRKDGKKSGQWRTVSKESEQMDIFAVEVEKVKLPLCLGIYGLVHVYPGSIIVVAGTSNSGKSAFALNLLFAMLADVSTLRDIYNIYSIGADMSQQGKKKPSKFTEYLTKYMGSGGKCADIHYFNSEMAAPELKDRLNYFPGGADSFRGVNFWKRSGDFADAIRPNDINVIDYMECYDEFWKIGQWINEIHKELNKGIALVVLQKKHGALVGRGGELTMEKPRLYVNLESNAPHGGICKIVKAKSFADPKNNPNGLEIDFKLVDGWKFVPISGWRHVKDDKERAAINRKYAKAKGEKYAFRFETVNGEQVGLTFTDLEKWKESYPNLDVEAELEVISKKSSYNPWLEKKNWFFVVSNMLKKAEKQEAPF